MDTERPKILVVSGYHPKETFAVRIGEYLLKNNSNPEIKVVRYTGKPDSKTSTYNLRRFIENFGPVISPIILHSDDALDFGGVIVYCAKSKEEKKRASKPLLDFTLRYDGLITSGRFLTFNTKCSLIDLELNSKMESLQRAVDFVESFSEYLIDLYLKKGLKL